MNIPHHLKYAKTHEWIRVDPDGVVVGLSDHAQEELGDVVYVEPPAVDSELEAGQACGVLESVKAATDIYAPVSGDVIAVNEELASTPELVNQDPYGQGWMFKIRPRDPAEIEELLNASDYAHHVGA